jgi:hypothetical protein
MHVADRHRWWRYRGYPSVLKDFQAAAWLTARPAPVTSLLGWMSRSWPISQSVETGRHASAPRPVTPTPATHISVPAAFAVDLLLPTTDRPVPRLDVIRNPQYGDGVIATTVVDGTLEVRRISGASSDVLAVRPGYPTGDPSSGSGSMAVACRFGTAGLFGGELFAIVVYGQPCCPQSWNRTDVLRIEARGKAHLVASFGDCIDPARCLDIAFTAGNPGYSLGAYLCDSDLFRQLYHLDGDHHATALRHFTVPSDRWRANVRALEFDPTGRYGGHLTVAEADWHRERLAVIYQLLPNWSWRELTGPVSVDERFYVDLAFSPGGSLGALLYVIDTIKDTVLSVAPDGRQSVFASGFAFPDSPMSGPQGSISVDSNGERMFVADAAGVYRIRAAGSRVRHVDEQKAGWPTAATTRDR